MYLIVNKLLSLSLSRSLALSLSPLSPHSRSLALSLSLSPPRRDLINELGKGLAILILEKYPYRTVEEGSLLAFLQQKNPAFLLRERAREREGAEHRERGGGRVEKSNATRKRSS